MREEASFKSLNEVRQKLNLLRTHVALNEKAAGSAIATLANAILFLVDEIEAIKQRLPKNK
jgi:hypothetical protein